MQLSFDFTKKKKKQDDKKNEPQPILPPDDPWESIGYSRKQ